MFARSRSTDEEKGEPPTPRPLSFTSIDLRDVTLKNRVAVAPMHQYSGVDGFPTGWRLMNAGRFAVAVVD